MSNHGRILLIDTASEYTAVMLITDDQISIKTQQSPLQHGRYVLKLCDELLQQVKLSITDLASLSAIAYIKGPGSFTGIRMGASVAQGIAFANDLKILNIPTLEEKIIKKNYKNYEEFLEKYIAPLTKKYFQQKKFSSPEEIEPEYLNDIY